MRPSVPTWTGSDALGPTVQKPAGGGWGHPQRKTSILRPGVPPQPSLSPPPPISVQGVRIHTENERAIAVPNEHGKAKVYRNSQNFLLQKKERVFFLIAKIFSVLVFPKVSGRRHHGDGKKALKAFEYLFCLFTSVPLTINYSSSSPRINSQWLNVSQQAAA